MELVKGQKYDVQTLRVVGWTDGDGHEGYSHLDYFEADGTYRGADQHGIEPVVDGTAITEYRAVIDGSGGDDTYFEATDIGAAKEHAREWARAGSWGPEEDLIKVWVGISGEPSSDYIEVKVGGKAESTPQTGADW